MNWLLTTTILTAIGVEMGGEICYSFLRFVTHFLVYGFWGKLGSRLDGVLSSILLKLRIRVRRAIALYISRYNPLIYILYNNSEDLSKITD